MATETCIRFAFSSNLIKVKDVLSTVLSFMQYQFPYISDSDLFDLRLVFSELLVNAVIHGNKEDSGKKVELLIEVDQDIILSVIKDEGSGFDYPEVLSHKNNTDDFFCSHGRGLQLVDAMTEYMKFNNAGNEIEFCKKVFS